MRLQTFFMAHTVIHIPTLHEMCRETLNPHIGTGTSNLNVPVQGSRSPIFGAEIRPHSQSQKVCFFPNSR